MTFWGVDLYNLHYEVDKKHNEQVSLTYLREIEKEKNIEKSTESFQDNNPDITEETSIKLDLLNSIIVDVKIGDIFKIVIDKQTTVLFNGKVVLTIKDRSFGKKYLNIWAGEDSVDDDVSKYINSARKHLNY
jgi:hypothetical protein